MQIDKTKLLNELTEKHSEFCESLDGAFTKTKFDHYILTETVFSSLHYCLHLFVDAQVIDKIEEGSTGPYKFFTISKNNFDKRIRIYTDGNVILAKGDSFKDLWSDISAKKCVFEINNVEDFDWHKFSMQLLSYIHDVIYDKSAAYETKMNLALNPHKLVKEEE